MQLRHAGEQAAWASHRKALARWAQALASAGDQIRCGAHDLDFGLSSMQGPIPRAYPCRRCTKMITLQAARRFPCPAIDKLLTIEFAAAMEMRPVAEKRALRRAASQRRWRKSKAAANAPPLGRVMIERAAARWRAFLLAVPAQFRKAVHLVDLSAPPSRDSINRSTWPCSRCGAFFTPSKAKQSMCAASGMRRRLVNPILQAAWRQQGPSSRRRGSLRERLL